MSNQTVTAMENLHSTAAKLQALVKEVLKGEVSLEENVDKLLNLLGMLQPLSSTQADHKAIRPQLEQCAVTLWNFAVAKKSGGKLTCKLNAKVRHIATNMVFLCNASASEETILQKQIMMSLKTARAWLDAKEYTMANNPLTMATQCVQKCRELLAMEHPTTDEDVAAKKKKHVEIDKEFLKVLCYKAEMSFSEDQLESAMTNVLAAKELLCNAPQEAGYLSMLCYNFGVDCFQKHIYEHSVNWLRESFEIGKMKNAVGNKNQARTLRLLANAYMEWDGVQHCQKALNAIGLANAEHSHPAGLYLKVKILLQGETSEERLQSGLSDVLKHVDLTADLGLNTIKLLFQHDKRALAFEGLKQLSTRYQNCPEHYKVTLMHLEMLLQCKQIQQAKELAEDIITAHNKGSPLDVGMKKQFHLILWEQASQHYEGKQYTEALQWYNYSLSLFTSEEKQDKNQAKLHRNRASCLLGDAQYEKAQQTILEAEKCDIDSPHTYYLKFKIALIQNQEFEAIEALQKMTTCKADVKDTSVGHEKMDTDSPVPDPSSTHGLLCLAAQLAFEQSNSKVAISALETLIDLSPDPLQVLTALRCLSRLRLTNMLQSPKEDKHRDERCAILSYVEKAHGKLNSLSINGQLAEANLQNEAVWFMKIAWNMAMQSEDMPPDMHQLFIMCSKLTNLCPQDLNSLVRQKTCLLMAAASCLQSARQSEVKHKAEVYRRAIEHVDDCHKVCSRIEEFRLSDADTRPGDTMTPLLLVLYEFEARAKLGDGGVEQVLEKALSLPQCDPKTFETISALAMDPPLQNRNMSMKSLQIAIRKHLQNENVDYCKCSKAFHSLIELSLQNSSINDLAGKDDTWIYFTDVIDIIENKAKGTYPEMEILWLMTKAWNCGVHLFSTSHYGDAVRWCELAMRLLKHLGVLKDNYQGQMTTVYGEILSKMDPSKESGAKRITV